MDRIKGLKEYVKDKRFKDALNIPINESVELKLLAQGEYNINYLFSHPVTEDKLLLRINTGSQMHLENQIEYEYNALNTIYKSGRVPKTLYVDNSKNSIDFGVLVMEFLEGEPLNYEKDLPIAAAILSDIHSVDVKDNTSLIAPKNPLLAMLQECTSMANVYMESDLGDEKVKAQLKRLIKLAKEKIISEKDYKGDRALINTELNSGNFLINGIDKNNYLIDWEKPILGEVAQDIAHFLAPITTFWKTDIILSRSQMEEFIEAYIKAVNGRFETKNLYNRFNVYMPLTCLRGVTWCAMAFIEYQSPDRVIKNEFTYKKIKAYLEPEFLDNIEKQYF